MTKGFVFSATLALAAFILTCYLAYLLLAGPTTPAASSMTIPIAILLFVFFGIGVIFSGMAVLWRFRLIEPESTGNGDFRFRRVPGRSNVDYSTLRLVKLIGSEDDQTPSGIKHAIVKLDGRYWLLQRMDSLPGIYERLMTKKRM